MDIEHEHSTNNNDFRYTSTKLNVVTKYQKIYLL